MNRALRRVGLPGLTQRPGVRRTALVAAALVMTALPLSVARPSVADSAAPTISFRVVEPDGSPVVRPVVMVSGMGPAYTQVHMLAGGAAGQVVVPFPADDPVAAAALAAGEPVDLMIRVFDKAPGSADINAAYVGAAIGVDAFGTLRELSAVTGTTVALAAGRTDFHAFTVGRGIADTLPTVGEPPPGGADCRPLVGNAYQCTEADYPDNARHTLVPIAENHGAGNEMVSSITYTSTDVTTTETAVQVGTGGFAEVSGSVAYAKENTTRIGYNDVGPDDNTDALLDTEYERDRTWTCAPGPAGTRIAECQEETLYRPYLANGAAPLQSDYALNDHMDPHNDCWGYVDAFYEPVTKSTISASFSFKLSAEEKWGTLSNQGNLKATTTVTQQTHSGKSYIRRWEVVESGKLYPHHYVYVPYGLYAPRPYTISNSKCLAERIGDIRTAAEWTDWTNPPVDGVQNPHPSDPTDDEYSTEQPVCGNMPDRCD